MCLDVPAQGGPEAGCAVNEVHRQHVTVHTVWGADECEYAISIPTRRDQPLPVLLLLTGNGELDRPDYSLFWLDSSQNGAMDHFLLQSFIIVTPLVKRDSATFSRRELQAEVLWALFRTAVGRVGPQLADCSRLCVTGYSLGADAAMLLALRYGACLSAVVLFAGKYARALREPRVEAKLQAKNVHMRVFHSEGDSYCSPSHSREAMRWLWSILGEDVGDQLRRGASWPDPSPPSGLTTAQIEYDITTYPGSFKELWIWRNYVTEDRTMRRGHVCWDHIYGMESVFGFFRGMLEHRSKASLAYQRVFEASLPRPPPCCDLPECPAHWLGLAAGAYSASETRVAGKSQVPEGELAEDAVLLGFAVVRGTPAFVWNVEQMVVGKRADEFMVGDQIISVNGKENAEDILKEINCPGQPISTLRVCRPFDIQADAGLHAPEERDRLLRETHLQARLHETHCRGHFGVHLCGDRMLDAFAPDRADPCACGRSREDCRLQAEDVRWNWMSTGWRLGQLCSSFLAEEFQKLLTNSRASASRVKDKSCLDDLDYCEELRRTGELSEAYTALWYVWQKLPDDEAET